MKLYENIAESLWHSCLNEDLCSAELYIQKLNEKALFGSMASSIKKWQKQIIQLTYEIRWIESGKVNPEVAQAIKAWKEAAADLSKKMDSPEFKMAVKAVDDNTGWFGRDKGKLGKKGSGFTSTRVNKDFGLVEEGIKVDADIDKIQATFTEFAKSAQNFVNQTKNLAQYGVKLPGTNFKKFLKKAGPVLSLGGLALGIAATAMTGGAAAPILAGVAGGMKTVGLGLTAGRSFAGAERAFARGENGKGVLKTGLGALSAYGAGVSAANISGNVHSLKAAHQAAEEAAFKNSLVAPGTDTSPAMSPEWQTYKDGGVVDNWQNVEIEQPDTMGFHPDSVAYDANDIPDAAADAAANAQEATNVAQAIEQADIKIADETAEQISQVIANDGGTITDVTDNGFTVETPTGETTFYDVGEGEITATDAASGEAIYAGPTEDIVEASKEIETTIKNVAPDEKIESLTNLIKQKGAAEAEYWSKVSPNAASEAWHFDGHNWHGWCRGNDVGISTVGADGNTHYFLNGQEVDYNTALAKMGGGNRIGDHTGHFSLEFKYPGKDYYFTKLEGTTETGLLGGPGWMDNSSLGKNDIDGFIKTGATWKS